MYALAVSLLLAQSDGGIAIPAVGRPTRDFYNAAGEQVVVLATADRAALAVGEWFTYTLRLSGLANAPSVERPKLEDLDGFQIEQLPEAAQVEKGRRTFAYRLRPRDTGIREVPPFAFRYYDPRDPDSPAAFRLALAKAIPLTIAIAPADVSDITAEEVYERYRREGDWFDEYGVLVLIILWSHVLIIAGYILESRGRGARRALWTLRSISRKTLPEQATLARTILRNYLRERSAIADPLQTAEELARGTNPAGADAVRRYLAACDALLYGRAAAAPSWTGLFREIAAAVEGHSR